MWSHWNLTKTICNFAIVSILYRSTSLRKEFSFFPIRREISFSEVRRMQTAGANDKVNYVKHVPNTDTLILLLNANT